MHLIKRLRASGARADDGFTLIEMVVTVAIVGIVATALTGMVISYLRTTLSTSARLTESNDIQFATVYWQGDVASIGVRSTTYNNDPAVHSFAFKQSVNTTPACSLPSGTTVITLARSSYNVSTPDTPDTVTVTYLASKATGSSVWKLTRVRCTNSTVNTTIVVASDLTAVPTVACTGGGVTGCSDSSGAVPTVVTMTLTSTDPNNNDGSTYTATLTGERRVT